MSAEKPQKTSEIYYEKVRTQLCLKPEYGENLGTAQRAMQTELQAKNLHFSKRNVFVFFGRSGTGKKPILSVYFPCPRGQNYKLVQLQRKLTQKVSLSPASGRS
jgi:ABC-type transport system involved in cytochrome bd biosynthesis fused ATPase/permease subunit